MRVVGVDAAVDDVHHRHRQDVGVGAADVAVQRQLQLVGGGLGDGEADAEDGVGAEPGLVVGAVELDQRGVDEPLVEGVDAAQLVGDLAVDEADGGRRRPCRRSARRRRAARRPRARRSTPRSARRPRPLAPLSSTTSTSTVGLPREVEDLAAVRCARSRSLVSRIESRRLACQPGPMDLNSRASGRSSPSDGRGIGKARSLTKWADRRAGRRSRQPGGQQHLDAIASRTVARTSPPENPIVVDTGEVARSARWSPTPRVSRGCSRPATSAGRHSRRRPGHAWSAASCTADSVRGPYVPSIAPAS